MGRTNTERRYWADKKREQKLALIPLLQAEEDLGWIGYAPTDIQYACMSLMYYVRRTHGLLLASCIGLVCDIYQRSVSPSSPFIPATHANRRYRKALAEEAEIMKHVPGWKVGESVYRTKVTWIPPRY